MDEKEPTQRTEKGLEIPIPTREDFMKNLRKVAKPRRAQEDDRAEDSDDEG